MVTNSFGSYSKLVPVPRIGTRTRTWILTRTHTQLGTLTRTHFWYNSAVQKVAPVVHGASGKVLSLATVLLCLWLRLSMSRGTVVRVSTAFIIERLWPLCDVGSNPVSAIISTLQAQQ